MSQNVSQQNFQETTPVITIISVEPLTRDMPSVPQNYIDTTAETISTTPLPRLPQASRSQPTALNARFVQSVSLDYFTTATLPYRATGHFPSTATTPNWLLMCSWLGLGIFAIAISVRAWVLVFFPEATALESAANTKSELLFRILGATIVNLCSLTFFSILGRQIGHQLQLAPHRIDQLRQIRRAFYARTPVGRILRPLFR